MFQSISVVLVALASLAPVVVVYLLARRKEWPRIRLAAAVAFNVIALVAVLLVMNHSDRVLFSLPLLIAWALYLLARWRRWPETAQLVLGLVLLAAFLLYLIWILYLAFVLYVMIAGSG